eukprot:TRINITY_DN7350_c0_g1_i1.p1 TRINITY_DN7350_c0_g1~~TRINITY_DN7350_c0_g1_i1.p1  ORF type:complete len:399 (+),score=56.31 TRINITY_DN7350_c0_g1_i1:53-1198(+)
MAYLAAAACQTLLPTTAKLPGEPGFVETSLVTEEEEEEEEEVEEAVEDVVKVIVYFALNGERIAQLKLRRDVTVLEMSRTVAVAAERSRRAAFPCNPRLIFREMTLNEEDTLETAGVYDGANITADVYPAIVTASMDNSAKIWNGLSGKCEKTLQGHTSGLHAACFGPDGRFVATASEDHTARLWLSVTAECWRTLTGHTDAVYSVSFSPDGKSLVTASGDHTARIWGVKNGNCLHVLEGHSAPVFAASFSLDGRAAITASRDCTLKEWNLKTGLNERTSPKAQEPVYSTSFSPNGKFAVTAQGEWTAKILNVKSGECEIILEGHQGMVVSANYAPAACEIMSPRSAGVVAKRNQAATVRGMAKTLSPKPKDQTRLRPGQD